jgi:hypothetical protein
MSETLVTHKKSNFKEVIKSENLINEWFLFQEKHGLNKR